MLFLRLRRVRILAGALAVLVLVAGVRLATGPSGSTRRVRAVESISSTSSTTQAPTTTTAVTEPTTTTSTSRVPARTATTTRVKPVTTTAPARAKAAALATSTTTRPRTTTTVRKTVRKVPVAAPALAAGGGAFRGLGTWIDVYDWTNAYTKDKPTVGPDDVDRMADAGVQTLYVQAARGDTVEDVAEVDRLQAIIDRARARGVAVVAWYLPYLTDLDADMRHLRAIAAMDVDALGVDIESKAVSDVDERNRRLVQLSAAMREVAGKLPVAGIVLPPVVLDVINTNYWPNFPWHDIAPSYDVWMPMGYWTNRTQASGYRDAYRYTVENVARLREDLGLPDAVVHAAGGIGDKTTGDDIDGFVRAIADTGAVGGSIYDYHTTAAALWSRLGALRIQ